MATKKELEALARELEIDGRSAMDKAELEAAVEAAEAEADDETESNETPLSVKWVLHGNRWVQVPSK